MRPFSTDDICTLFDEDGQVVNLTGIASSAFAYLISTIHLKDPKKNLTIICATEKEQSELENDIRFFSQGKAKILSFPEPDVLPYNRISSDPDIGAQRIKILNDLLYDKSGILIATLRGILRKLPPTKFIRETRKNIYAGDITDRDHLIEELIDFGYTNEPVVEDLGEFSVRGALLDIWSPGEEMPVRIEFDGDKIISMKAFEPSTQRSKEKLSEIVILPALDFIISKESIESHVERIHKLCVDKEIQPSQRRSFIESLRERIPFPGIETLLPLFHNETSTLTDYLSENAHWIIASPAAISEQAKLFFDELANTYESSSSFERIVEIDALYERWDHFFERLKQNRITTINDLALPHTKNINCDTDDLTEFRQRFGIQKESQKKLTPLIEAIEKWQQQHLTVAITCSTPAQKMRMKDILEWLNVKVSDREIPFCNLGKESSSFVYLIEGELSNGFVWQSEKIVLLTETDIFGKKVRRPKPTTAQLDHFTSFAELEEGDFLVHEIHGICRYLGLNHLAIDSEESDYLLLEFLGGDKLYLPVYRMKVVGRYSGPENEPPFLDKLGSLKFEVRKSKAKKEILKIAKELIEIYAARMAHPGKAFPSDDHLMEEFSASFPYEETQDQLKAIDDIRYDMEEPKPMDRLICGDVGYGKTEVAMRAAFKAAMAGSQVAILVPTTILAFQHFETFTERFKDWPVKIASISRMQKSKELKKILEDLKKGAIDILIGTHKIIQKNVEFKSLGLLIIDEEQRFGVKQKERLKEFKKTVDVITMTATPIPRTLSMSLSGIRDLSLITTPPIDRHSISTHLARYDDGIIKHAIKNEIERGGQIFFVHNRVQTIHSYYDRLKKLIPEARIAVAHGQMPERGLEKIMHDFRQKKYDVLLCTTIIESGLDIPSANTIIINRADKMGLSQLYQLRGRVGRSSVHAFAYLLIPEEGDITKTAHRRLSALTRYTELGSGFQIATHDLEIRGSGNILGEAQSGHAAELGFELYTRLLEKAVRELKGEAVTEEIDPEIKIPLKAFLPEEYIADPATRVDLYKRLSSQVNQEDLADITREIEDRFGKMPDVAADLIRLMEIRLIAQSLCIQKLAYDKNHLLISLHPSTNLNFQKLAEAIAMEGQKFKFSPPANLIEKIEIPKDANSCELLKTIKNSLFRLSRYVNGKV
ncbi:MAG: transcription-repair coupling factor [Pseudomonadota bacterium]